MWLACVARRRNISLGAYTRAHTHTHTRTQMYNIRGRGRVVLEVNREMRGKVPSARTKLLVFNEVGEVALPSKRPLLTTDSILLVEYDVASGGSRETRSRVLR